MMTVIPDAAAAQPAIGYTSTIDFQWVGSPPSQILEDGLPGGPQSSDRILSPHRWESQHNSVVPLSRIYIAYAGQKYLLPYRSFRGAPPTRVIFGQPSFTCTKDGVDGVEAALGQDVPTQISAMMAAGNLLLRPPAQCPTSSRNRLIDLYFRLNCRLASHEIYIGYLEEAEGAYRTRWAGDAERAQFAQRCRASASGAFRNAIAGQVTHLAHVGQLADAAALGRDVRALRLDPAWAETFRDYALNEVDINAWEISRLVTAQVAAQQADQDLEAQRVNAQLMELAHDPAQLPAFNRAQVSIDRILNDSRQIQAAIALSSDITPR